MTQPALPDPIRGLTPPARHLLEALVLAAAFAVAHTQSPLYFSNQNQYLLHGAALAKHGHLAHDWLATTRDPTPLFSWLVAGAYSVHEWLLQPAYFAMLMGYFLAARWLVAAIPGAADTRAKRVAFAALFTLAHAGIVRWGSVQLTGGDYPWLLQAGLAAQYMVGPGIQPSAFGILLLAAVAACANDRSPIFACALAASACLFHATYLLPAGLLILGFLVAAWVEKQDGRLVLRMIGVSALLMSAPLAHAFALMHSGGDRTEAVRILADVRIPHHCNPVRWFDWLAALQLVWMAVGWYFVRSHPIGLALFVAALGGAVLTGVLFFTGSHELALMFPWRISVLLVPVSTAVIIAKLLAWKPPARTGELIAGVGLLALVAGGIVVTACGLGYRMVDEHELYDHVRATAGPEDVYLLPVSMPNTASGRGAVSNTFAPPPRAKEGTNQIPVDLQRFRLMTGARIYVDYKSVPYAPAEVQEWFRRMAHAVGVYAKSVRDYDVDRQWLKDEGITHVVTPAEKPFVASFLKEEKTVGGYIVYRVQP